MIKYKGDLIIFDLIVLNDLTGKLETGLTVGYVISDLSDNSTIDSGNLVETASHYQVSYTFATVGNYRIKYTTPAGYKDGEEVFEVVDKDTLKADVSSLALETSVQANTTLLSSATYGLSALKDLIDLLDDSTESQARFDEIKGAGWSTETLVAIKDLLDTVSSGVSAIDLSDLALETSVQANNTLLSNATYGLSALKDLLDAIDTSTELQARFTEIKGASWTTETLKAIKTAVDNISVGSGSLSIYRIFSPVYSTIRGQACMTSATKKMYGNAVDCEADTNPTATYLITATYDSAARMLTYKENLV